MSKTQQLILEILSGPLDGHVITLQETTGWSRAGQTLLSFPWDVELGEPQARFVVRDDGWYLEGLEAPHGTYCINREERVTGKTVPLAQGDLLKASGTWLRVREVGGVLRQAQDDMLREAPAPDEKGSPLEAQPPQQQPLAPQAPYVREQDTRDQELAKNLKHFDEAFAALAARLQERGIEVEIDDWAREFICDPFWTKTTLEDALANLVEEPLIKQLEAGEFEQGDRVLVKRYTDHLEFHKCDTD